MNKPRIGLALGSGAARGWAHIGVIRALQDMGIEVDIVTGTSIGSLVGGAYAAGKLDELEQWVRDMDRWQVFNLLDFGLTNGGMVSGEKVFNTARQKFGAMHIENLKKRYAAIATDLYTGREIWLRAGDIYSVSRASCAMPGLLSPKYWQGRWLVDGALVNPVPVSLARALEADFVIAVHLNSQVNVKNELPPQDLSPLGLEEQAAENARRNRQQEPSDEGRFQHILARGQNYFQQVKEKLGKDSTDSLERSKAPGMVGVMAGSIDIMQERITKARMAGDPPDVLLQPKLGEVGLLEFDQGELAIAIGYETTMRLKDMIVDDIALLEKRYYNGR